MRQRLHSHLSYANVMATLAVFLVLSGGTAVALNGVDTVQSDDLGPGAQVKAPDVADNAVNSADVVNDSIAGADINESTLGQVPSARSATLGGKGRSSSSEVCNPGSGAFVSCAQVAITLPASSRVLLSGQAMMTTNADVGATASCRLASASHGVEPDSLVFARTTHPLDWDQVTTTAVWGPFFPAGTYSFGIDCNDPSTDDVLWQQVRITAVALSGS